MKYRKKPVVVDAWPIRALLKDLADGNWTKLPAQVRDNYEDGRVLFMPDKIGLHTPEGWLTGERDDMLICGVKGELYPCKPDIFAATYVTYE